MNVNDYNKDIKIMKSGIILQTAAISTTCLSLAMDKIREIFPMPELGI